MQAPVGAQPPKRGNSLTSVQEKHRERFRKFSNEIEKLAQECDENSLVEEAKQIREREITPDAESLRVYKLPTEVRPEIPADQKKLESDWPSKLRLIEKDYAKDLYTQARAASNQGFPSYAYNLVREAAVHDPDHQQVRKVLGFVRRDKEWVTPFAYSQITKGNVWHEDFGWLPKAHRQKYIDGERYFKTRWISAEKEKELRRDFNSAWEIQTDHYLIKTNVSLEKGVELGKSLEDFHEMFYETFAGFFNTPEQLQKMFDGGGKQGRSVVKPYSVHFYRSRDEYRERLRKFFPSIDQTNGVYMTSDHVAHFYDDPHNNHEGTLFHEATHQLFFESQNQNRIICENQHFWIIEGIACYMESFQRRNGSFTLGDPKYIRFAGARHNLLRENYYVPLREFSGFGMQEFQSVPGPELAKNYTQAAGLARFFMHYEKGRYREALVKHLEQLYNSDARKRERADGLDELTGVEFADLDRQYAEDTRQTDDQLSAR